VPSRTWSSSQWNPTQSKHNQTPNL
jgi:hypothetical protein